MLAAVNSKHGRYEPRKYMLNAKRLQEKAERDRREREPMTGEQVLARFRQLGVPIIDKRRAASLIPSEGQMSDKGMV